jgi:ABC-type nitrate/sulfonate/bicarbonate transport system permease component
MAERVLPPLLFALFVLVAWQLYVVLGDVKESTLPPPTAIAESLWVNRTMLAENAWVTIKEILIGYSVAIVIGVGIAARCTRGWWSRRWCRSRRSPRSWSSGPASTCARRSW